MKIAIQNDGKPALLSATRIPLCASV